jgi:O-antigen ligase
VENRAVTPPAPAPTTGDSRLVVGGRRLPAWPFTALVGVATGCLLLSLGTSDELRWLITIVLAIAAAVVVVVVPNRLVLLASVFVLSLQADVYLRPMYGRAGTVGLEIPLCVCTGILLYGYLRVMGTRAVVHRGELTPWILAILGTTLVAAVFSAERFAGVARLLFELELVLVYILGLNIVLMDGGLHRLVRLLAITLAIQAIVMFVETALGINFSLLGETTALGDIPRPGGTVSSNPAGFASYIMPLIMILAARFTSRRSADEVRDSRRTREGVLVVLGIVAIVMTYTRAAWAGLAIGFVAIIVVGFRRRDITMKQVGIVLIAMVITAIVCLPIISARLTEAPLGESYDERAALNRMAMLVITAHPVFGIGPGAYGFAYKNYLTDEFSNDWLYTVHNEYLLRTAETGVIGGLVFVIFLLKAFGQLRRASMHGDWEQRTFAVGMTAGMLAVCWQMYWVPWRGFSYNAMLWLLLGAGEGVTRLQKLEQRDAVVQPLLQDGLDAQQRRTG